MLDAFYPYKDELPVHGGIGFTWEHDAHLFYKRLLTLREQGGGASGQLEELAGLVLDDPG